MVIAIIGLSVAAALAVGYAWKADQELHTAQGEVGVLMLQVIQLTAQSTELQRDARDHVFNLRMVLDEASKCEVCGTRFSGVCGTCGRIENV